MPHTTAHQPDPPHHTPGPDRDCDTWHRALEVLREAGAQAGRDAADWWEQGHPRRAGQRRHHRPRRGDPGRPGRHRPSDRRRAAGV